MLFSDMVIVNSSLVRTSSAVADINNVPMSMNNFFDCKWHSVVDTL